MGSGKKEEPEYVALRSERRKHLRKEMLVLRVKGEDSKGAFFGYAKTIGGGGMYITSVYPKKLGEEFELSFRLDGDSMEIRCKGTVVWVREYAPHGEAPGMGIKFIDLDPEDKKKIEDWINRR